MTFNHDGSIGGYEVPRDGPTSRSADRLLPALVTILIFFQNCDGSHGGG